MPKIALSFSTISFSRVTTLQPIQPGQTPARQTPNARRGAHDSRFPLEHLLRVAEPDFGVRRASAVVAAAAAAAVAHPLRVVRVARQSRSRLASPAVRRQRAAVRREPTAAAVAAGGRHAGRRVRTGRRGARSGLGARRVDGGYVHPVLHVRDLRVEIRNTRRRGIRGRIRRRDAGRRVGVPDGRADGGDGTRREDLTDEHAAAATDGRRHPLGRRVDKGREAPPAPARGRGGGVGTDGGRQGGRDGERGGGRRYHRGSDPRCHRGGGLRRCHRGGGLRRCHRGSGLRRCHRGGGLRRCHRGGGRICHRGGGLRCHRGSGLRRYRGRGRICHRGGGLRCHHGGHPGRCRCSGHLGRCHCGRGLMRCHRGTGVRCRRGGGLRREAENTSQVCGPPAARPVLHVRRCGRGGAAPGLSRPLFYSQRAGSDVKRTALPGPGPASPRHRRRLRTSRVNVTERRDHRAATGRRGVSNIRRSASDTRRSTYDVRRRPVRRHDVEAVQVSLHSPV